MFIPKHTGRIAEMEDYVNCFRRESLFFPGLNLGIVTVFKNFSNYFIFMGKYEELQTILHSVATGEGTKHLLKGFCYCYLRKEISERSLSNFLCSWPSGTLRHKKIT